MVRYFEFELAVVTRVHVRTSLQLLSGRKSKISREREREKRQTQGEWERKRPK